MTRVIDWLWTVAVVAVTVAALGVICVLLWGSIWPSYGDYAYRIRFESAAWKDETRQSDDNPVRLRMVDDLLRRYRLVGMPKEEVDDLLGVPPKTGYFRDFDYVYWLGPERGFMSIDSEWLVLKFKEGKVIEARVVRD